MKKIVTLLLSALVFNAHALELTHEMGTAHFETTPQKVIALDWALSETVLSLGIERWKALLMQKAINNG